MKQEKSKTTKRQQGVLFGSGIFRKRCNNLSRGFTLLEMTVSLGLFTIIMSIATNTFLSVVSADRKSRAVRVAADNLNVALEDMSRRIKTGSSYYCGAGGEALLSVNDCTAVAQNTLFFTDQNGDRVKYTLIGGSIWRSVGVEPIIQATSPEINITQLKFYVSGSSGPPNNTQPMVVISASGNLGTGTTATTFTVQSTATQRGLDV